MNEIKTWFEKLFIDEAKPALDRHSGGGGGLGDVNATDVTTPEEMDLILANATVSNTGDVYHYTGETTENYTQDTYYVLIGEIKLQEKEATGNGEIVPDEGYDGLSKVSVNAPSIVKQLIQLKGSPVYLFYYWKDITDFSGLIEYDDFSDVTDMSTTFGYCELLTEIPLFDTSNITNMSSIFTGCKNLTTVPLFDTSNVTNMKNMFAYCSNLSTVPLFDTSNVTIMEYMFSGCTNLTSVPLFDTSNATNVSRMFASCTNLTSIPLLNLKKVSSITGLFMNCTNLSDVPAIDIGTANYYNGSGIYNDLFYNCSSLTNFFAKNIRYSLYLSYSTNFTMDSLLSLLNETVYNTSSGSRTLTVGTANLAKFVGEYEYVKPTGVYLDLDDNEVTRLSSGHTKIPVTWCSASDEGAMTIVDYMTSKGWNIA